MIYAVVSAQNNCEMCLSFHAAALGGDDMAMTQADVDEILAGGLPQVGDGAQRCP